MTQTAALPASCPARFKLDFIGQRLDSMALGQNGVASLFREDGTVLVSKSRGKSKCRRRLEQGRERSGAMSERVSGTFAGDGSMDGVPAAFCVHARLRISVGRRCRHCP